MSSTCLCSFVVPRFFSCNSQHAFRFARHFGIVKPHLVVVPLSTMKNWERELSIWAPQLRIVSIYGNQETRDTILKYELFAPVEKFGEDKIKAKSRSGLQMRVKFHVLLTSYELAIAESGHLSKIDYECLIVDEGHRLKSKNSKLQRVTFTSVWPALDQGGGVKVARIVI